MKFVKNSENVSQISKKKSIFFGFDKAPNFQKKWPKTAIKRKISGVDKAQKNSRPPQNLSDYFPKSWISSPKIMKLGRIANDGSILLVNEFGLK